MMQQDRNIYWQALAESHNDIAHNRPIFDGNEEVGIRKSFVPNITGDELAIAEFVKLDTPCLAIALTDGRIRLSDGQPRQRITNTLFFLDYFGTKEEDANMSLSKTLAFDKTFEIMKDFINKLQSDYDDDPCNSFFDYIDDNSYQWECVDIEGANLCGWQLTFDDETRLHISINPDKWT